MKSPDRKKPASLWIHKAFQDYAAGRCLLLNDLFGGFILAQKSVEKMLKAYLHLAHPERKKFVGREGLINSILPVTPSHDLVAHASLVEQAFPSLNLQLTTVHRWLLEELSYQFHQKYPDNESLAKSSTTEWLRAIDALMVQLSLRIPIDPETRWCMGIFSAAWPLVLTNQPDPPWWQWVRNENQSFAEVFAEIYSIINEGHNSCYPGQAL
jgi:hypothetical protein